MKKRIVFLVLALLVCLSLFACNGDGPKVADNTEYYDAITKTLSLNKEYEGKSFLSDGIGNATVDAFTDGDTVRFKLASNEIVIVRFYQVDTPESTSSVEKWGKAASLFTKERLSSATEVVLEATGPKAVHDSYGTRYLGYVWYKTADGKFKNLNLELVENGFSENKGINTEDYPYYNYFNKANKFAMSVKLRIYSDLDDPLYSTDPIDMTIKEFLNNTDSYYNKDTKVGAKVKLIAYLSSLYCSPSGTYTYTVSEYDAETKKVYSISLYAGYASSGSSRMKIGHLYSITGDIQEYNGKYQLSNIIYEDLLSVTGDGYTVIKQKNYFVTFDSTVEYISQYSNTLYSDVTVVESSVNNNVLTIVGTTNQRSKTGLKDEVNTYTFTVSVPENYQNVFTAGTKFSVQAFQFVANSGEFTILSYSNITIR